MPNYIYEEIKNYLLSLIKENREIASYKLPSENALAKKFGTTRITAKKALSILADEGLVVSYHGKGTFIKGEKISVPSTTNEFVCMFLPNVQSQFISDIIAGVQKTLTDNGLELLICHCPTSSSLKQKLITNIVDLKVKGIIFFPQNNCDCYEDLILLEKSNFPVILIDRTLSEVNANSVMSDHKSAAINAVNLLVNRGCTEIGMISLPKKSSSSIKLRVEGYMEALEKNSLSVESENILYIDDNYSESEKLKEQILEFLSEKPHLDGLISTGGKCGLMLYSALKELDIKVPNAFKVIFFDDEYSDLIQLLPFSPTCIKQNGNRIGHEAAKILLNLLKTSNSIINNRIYIDCTIIERDSTKQAPTSQIEPEDEF